MAERNALSLLKQIILQALDVPTVAGLENEGMGLAGLSCRQIVDHLRRMYGAATPEIFQAYITQALIPYATTSAIEDHINVHRTVHRYANDMGQPFNEHRKVESLRDTLLPCGIFTQAFKIYAANHPGFENRTFANFSDAIIQERNSTSATTSMAGYSASMVTTDSRYEALEGKLDNFMAYMTKEARKPGGRGPTTTPKPADNTGYEYCWRHGRTHHNSSECRLRHEPGHQARATFKNQMGGKKA